MSSPDLDTGPTRMAETRARQGFRDRPVLIVLAVSLLLAVIAVFGIMMWQPDRLAGADAGAGAQAGSDARDAVQGTTVVQPPKSN